MTPAPKRNFVSRSISLEIARGESGRPARDARRGIAGKMPRRASRGRPSRRCLAPGIARGTRYSRRRWQFKLRAARFEKKNHCKHEPIFDSLEKEIYEIKTSDKLFRSNFTTIPKKTICKIRIIGLAALTFCAIRHRTRTINQLN